MHHAKGSQWVARARLGLALRVVSNPFFDAALVVRCSAWVTLQRWVRGVQIDGSLMDIVREPLLRCGADHNSTIAFCDNSSAQKGYEVLMMRARVLIM